MPITINKNNGETALTINNFANLVIDGSTASDLIPDIGASENEAILIKALGASMVIGFDYTLVEEASTVVSGTGGTVTSARGQMKYLYDTLMSKGSSSFTDKYRIALEFSTTPLDSGTASAGAAATLTDGSKSWAVNAYAGQVLKITGGTGAGQIRSIVSNTATVLTISTSSADDWDTNPDNTSTYQIIDGFSRRGNVDKITCTMSSDQPLTFKGSMQFKVGKVI